MAYAKGTAVSVAKSQAEIQQIIMRYGARSFAFGQSDQFATIAFEANNLRVKFILPLPDRNSKPFTTWRPGNGHREELLPPARAAAKWEQACRERWRSLGLCIKAKLEAVDAGITTFEDEFMAHIVLPNGERVRDQVIPAIALAYKTNTMLPLIEGPKS